MTATRVTLPTQQPVCGCRQPARIGATHSLHSRVCCCPPTCVRLHSVGEAQRQVAQRDDQVAAQLGVHVQAGGAALGAPLAALAAQQRVGMVRRG